jgi:hypothetical protein
MSETPFHPPWPFAFANDHAPESRSLLLSACLDMRRRCERYLASPKRQRLFARKEALLALEREYGTEYQNELLLSAHRAVLRTALAHARRSGAEARETGEMAAVLISLVGVSLESHPDFDSYDVMSALVKEQADKLAVLADSVREELRSMIHSGLVATSRHPETFAAMLQGMAEDLSDAEAVSIAAPLDEDLTSAMFDAADDAAIDRALADAPGRLEPLRAAYLEAKHSLDEIWDRMDLAEAFVIDPVDQLYRQRAGELGDPLALILAGQLVAECRVRVHGVRPRRADTSRVPPLPSIAVVGGRREFWHMVLFQILAQHGAIRDGGFVPGAIELLGALLERPARLTRVPVPRELEKCRTALAKRVAPFVRPQVLQAEGQILSAAALAAVPQELALAAVSMGLALSLAVDPATKEVGTEAQNKAVQRLIEEYLRPHAGEYIEFLHRCEVLRTAQAPGPAEEAPPVEEPALPPEAPAPAPLRVLPWFYVDEPGNPRSPRRRVELREEARLEDFTRFLGDRGIPPIVKPVSLLNALDFYLRMPLASRALLPQETVGLVPWPKLKRGRIRILAREEDGCLLFHIYARRDWQNTDLLK